MDGELVKAVDRGWIRQFGPMEELRTDDGAGLAPERFAQFLEQHGFPIMAAAGEARTGLEIAVRRSRVVREAR
eukprot:6538363-Pyramimonas_sp.AAC.1